MLVAAQPVHTAAAAVADARRSPRCARWTARERVRTYNFSENRISRPPGAASRPTTWTQVLDGDHGRRPGQALDRGRSGRQNDVTPAEPQALAVARESWPGADPWRRSQAQPCRIRCRLSRAVRRRRTRRVHAGGTPGRGWASQTATPESEWVELAIAYWLSRRAAQDHRCSTSLGSAVPGPLPGDSGRAKAFSSPGPETEVAGRSAALARHRGRRPVTGRAWTCAPAAVPSRSHWPIAQARPDATDARHRAGGPVRLRLGSQRNISGTRTTMPAVPRSTIRGGDIFDERLVTDLDGTARPGGPRTRRTCRRTTPRSGAGSLRARSGRGSLRGR